MSFLTDAQWRNKLIDTLCRLAVAKTPIGRDALVAGIQTGLTRDHSHTTNDVTHIVTQLVEGEDVDGLRILLENALRSKPAPRFASELNALRAAMTPSTASETSSTPDLAPLRTVLATLYESAGKARIVASDLGLDLSRLDLAGPASVFWYEIVRETAHQQRLKALVQRAFKDFPENTALKDAVKASGLVL